MIFDTGEFAYEGQCFGFRGGTMTALAAAEYTPPPPNHVPLINLDAVKTPPSPRSESEEDCNPVGFVFDSGEDRVIETSVGRVRFRHYGVVVKCEHCRKKAKAETFPFAKCHFCFAEILTITADAVRSGLRRNLKTEEPHWQSPPLWFVTLLYCQSRRFIPRTCPTPKGPGWHSDWLTGHKGNLGGR